MYDEKRFDLTTAILVDGGFYRRRAQRIWGDKTPAERANELHKYCMKHLNYKQENNRLYRIFYYDCPPITKKIYHPLLKSTIDFQKTELYSWTNEFFKELKNKRKVAIRLGKLADSTACYSINPNTVKQLCNGKKNIGELTDKDFILQLEQKGVDMKIGLDIASLAYKKQVDRIVLISGDSDFVPAAKYARREGIDFMLDPMRAKVKPELSEHIDGLHTFVSNSIK